MKRKKSNGAGFILTAEIILIVWIAAWGYRYVFPPKATEVSITQEADAALENAGSGAPDHVDGAAFTTGTEGNNNALSNSTADVNGGAVSALSTNNRTEPANIGDDAVNGDALPESGPAVSEASVELPDVTNGIGNLENAADSAAPANKNAEAAPSANVSGVVIQTAPAVPSDIRIVVCGDILLDGSVRNVINAGGLDAVFPVEHRGPFTGADIAVANLEMPFSNRGTPEEGKEYTFRGTPEHISLLTDMGLDLVTLANNHTLDYGRDAFADTLELLKVHNIHYAGGGLNKEEAMDWVTLEAGGKKIAFLSASRVMPTADWYAGSKRSGLFATYDPAEMNAQITAAKAEADYVIAYVHWGVERNDLPEQWQRDMARGYIDAGADAVIASHPHVLQGYEFYQGKLIAYSLGNFIFTDSAKDTAALELCINREGSISAKVHPYQIVKRSTVPITDPEHLETMRGHLNQISFGAVVKEDFTITETAVPEAAAAE